MLFERRPILDGDAILSRLQGIGRVDLFSKSDEVVGLAHPDHLVAMADRTIPSVTNIVRWSKPISPANFASALEQTYNWPQAEEAVARCQYKLLVSDLFGSALPYKGRYELITSVLQAVVEETNPAAIHWEAADSIVEPKSLDRRLSFYCNVRLYEVTNRKGNRLMDTKGLTELGLVDAQCLFRELDASEVASWLFQLARQTFDRGDFIKDGETLPGIDPAERWKCRHELAMAGPARPVIDITPSAPHAGER
ncbi:MAG TPA: DUF4261 domain-containing protein [Candidatus Dormibacteraeota bacterium]|nr:DUF4261 domain-containing protein [Candidatus Dormibacteraeota bacterium]